MLSVLILVPAVKDEHELRLCLYEAEMEPSEQNMVLKVEPSSSFLAQPKPRQVRLSLTEYLAPVTRVQHFRECRYEASTSMASPLLRTKRAPVKSGFLYWRPPLMLATEGSAPRTALPSTPTASSFFWNTRPKLAEALLLPGKTKSDLAVTLSALYSTPAVTCWVPAKENSTEVFRPLAILSVTLADTFMALEVSTEALTSRFQSLQTYLGSTVTLAPSPA
mmetsp:Transcript_3237/g.11299  ORF Transcript_3237/g.11299 Transcript_3237/m.11299 type:complete len:221 (+) Transcript_3237:115-777(+)